MFSMKDIYANAPSGWSACLSLYDDGVSINNNTTNIKFVFKVKKDSGSYTGTFPGSVNVTQTYYRSDNETFLGSLVSSGSTTYTINDEEYTEVFSQNLTVKHDDTEGDAYIRISFSFTTNDGEISFTEESYEYALPIIIRQALISSATNFTENENPTIKYSNPNDATKLEACISFTGGNDDIKYRSIPDDGRTYTFNLTAAEKQTLINAVTKGTSIKVRFYIKSYNAGKTFWSYTEATFSLSDALPYIQPVVVDMNSTTNALTGDVNTFVKYFSDAAAQVNATAKMGASIVSQKITNGNIVKNQDIAQFTGVESPKFVFSATDSRSNTATKTINVPMVDYIKLTCNQKAEIRMDGETSAAIKLEISGNYFNQSFGAVSNTLKIEVRHTQNDGYMGEWVDLTDGLIPIIENNTYKLDVDITGLKYDITCVIECRATDKLMSVSSGNNTVKLIPVFDWSDTDFNFNVPINMNGETILRHNKSANNLVLSTSGGHIYIRPQGTTSTTNEIKITPQGDIVIDGISLKSTLETLKTKGIIS